MVLLQFSSEVGFNQGFEFNFSVVAKKSKLHIILCY